MKDFPIRLMVDGEVQEVGRIGIYADGTLSGWISRRATEGLDLVNQLESFMLVPLVDHVKAEEISQQQDEMDVHKERPPGEENCHGN